MKRPAVLLLAVPCWVLVCARAESIPIGALFFDAPIPSADGFPGVNAFNILNFTGPSDLPPDFPASTALILTNAILTVDPSGGPPQVFPLGNIDSDSKPVVEFPSTIDFTSASFTAILDPTTFVLLNGDTFVANPTVSATLLPSSGALLQAGIDNALITAQPASTVPEPRPLIPMVIGLIGAAARSLVRRRKLNRVAAASR